MYPHEGWGDRYRDLYDIVRSNLIYEKSHSK